MRHTLTISAALVSILLITSTAAAQDTAAPATAPPAQRTQRSALQLAFQGRINAMGYLAPGDRLGSIQTITPYVTPGVRLIDGRLFLGLGIGFGGFSTTECQDTCADFDTQSQSYFALSPMVLFDVLRAGPAFRV